MSANTISNVSLIPQSLLSNSLTSATAKYYLNNSDVTVSNSIVLSENGYWTPLANPYPAKRSVSKFMQNPNNVQGQGVYVWNGTSFDLKQDDDIKVTEGFFVNYSSAGSHTATFKKSQLTNYPPSTKSEVASREFIEFCEFFINISTFFTKAIIVAAISSIIPRKA